MNKPFKTGDTVILTKRGGQREVRKVLHADDLVNIADSLRRSAYHFTQNGQAYHGSNESIQHATPELIAEVEAENKAREDAAKAEQARIAADPKTPYVSRFNSGFDHWEKLTLAELQQIAAWLDRKDEV